MRVLVTGHTGFKGSWLLMWLIQAGANVCGRLTQARIQPDPKYFLGSGKVQELALMVQEFGANIVIVDQELTANQQANLEEVVGVNRA